jgi:amino acid adenylation domain-containing protein
MTGYLLQHYIEASVRKFPRKPAIESDGRSITYEELWEKSGRLADNLVDMGYTGRKPVCIFMHKSIEAIVAMLGVLRAGGMYIPLDSHYSPLSRIIRIINSSKSEFLVIDTTQWKNLAAGTVDEKIGTESIARMNVILSDSMFSDTETREHVFDREDGHHVRYFDQSVPGTGSYDSTIMDDDLAYILYTSGSTGIPKGVMLTHRNALTFVDWAISVFTPSESDVFSNIAPLHFDLSVFDMFVSLACGASVMLVPHDISMIPRALLAWIGEKKITYFYSVPSVWISILNHADLKEGDLPDLTHVLFAGEVFPPRELEVLMTRILHTRFYNLYGPTETNVCTYHEVRSAADIKGKPVPIGRACANTEVLVLKDNDEEAAAGEEGELLVKGSIVTKGYYLDKERSLDAFRQSPIDRHHGSLLYKTGDIVRVIEQGVYAYAGRKDLMVKCSGFRVELQEIERALGSHPGVREAVAVPVFGEDRLNATRIAAFVTLAPDSGPGILELKEYLCKILPRYMVPEAIVAIDELPRNANGKADRQGLTTRANNPEAN